MKHKRQMHAKTIINTQKETGDRQAAEAATEEVTGSKARACAAHVGLDHGIGTGRYQDSEFFIRGTKEGQEHYADAGYSIKVRTCVLTRAHPKNCAFIII